MGIETGLLIGATVLSTAVGAATAYAGGQQQAAQAEAAQQAAEFNADLAERDARATAEQAAGREDMQRRRGRLFLSRARAAAAESGFGFEGSIADIAEQSAIEVELDNLTTRYEGALQRRGLLDTAAMQRREATNLGQAAGTARRSGLVGAGAHLLSGASTGYYRYRRLSLGGDG